MANSTIIINKLTNNLNAYTVESNFKTQDIIHALINFNESIEVSPYILFSIISYNDFLDDN